MSIADISQPTQVGLDSNGMLMTPDEYGAIEQWDENYRYELVHGVLIVTPPPGIGERKPNDELGYWLLSYRDSHPEGSHLDDTAPEHDITTRTGCRRAVRVIWAGLGGCQIIGATCQRLQLNSFPTLNVIANGTS
jgi:Uma2 family endonuclease